MSTQHWSSVETWHANTSTDGECDRNVRFEIVGVLVQTSKNCDVKLGRTFNSSATDLDKRWHETGKSCGCVFWWKPGYCYLLSYVTFLLDG